jgi:hypothetical protein
MVWQAGWFVPELLPEHPGIDEGHRNRPASRRSERPDGQPRRLSGQMERGT